MKKNNPLKKLRFLKKTIAHLDHEQMLSARGGETYTNLFCTQTNSVVTYNCLTADCDTSLCTV